jgi:hypothetical protein
VRALRFRLSGFGRSLKPLPQPIELAAHGRRTRRRRRCLPSGIPERTVRASPLEAIDASSSVHRPDHPPIDVRMVQRAGAEGEVRAGCGAAKRGHGVRPPLISTGLLAAHCILCATGDLERLFGSQRRHGGECASWRAAGDGGRVGHPGQAPGSSGRSQLGGAHGRGRGRGDLCRSRPRDERRVGRFRIGRCHG